MCSYINSEKAKCYISCEADRLCCNYSINSLDGAIRSKMADSGDPE